MPGILPNERVKTSAPRPTKRAHEDKRSEPAGGVWSARYAARLRSRSAAKMTSQKPESMKTLAKTLSVLDLFSDVHDEWRVTDISHKLALPVATTHRIVRSLKDHGYLQRTDRARYRLDERALNLGSRAVHTLDVRAALQPVLRDLVEETTETVILAVPDERRRCARCVDRMESTHPLRLSIDVGECIPLHAGAIAKAALAFLDTRVVDDVLGHDLERVGPATITDPAKLRDELELVRTRTWAYSYEETDVGAWGVAAPVLTLGGNLVAVVGVIAPTARHSQGATDMLAASTQLAAAHASQMLDPRLRRPAVTDRGAAPSNGTAVPKAAKRTTRAKTPG
jgi:IclR family transcriptional regulator, KDG regulon repressor